MKWRTALKVQAMAYKLWVGFSGLRELIDGAGQERTADVQRVV
jgi:hypothetical protein